MSVERQIDVSLSLPLPKKKKKNQLKKTQDEVKRLLKPPGDREAEEFRMYEGNHHHDLKLLKKQISTESIRAPNPPS